MSRIFGLPALSLAMFACLLTLTFAAAPAAHAQDFDGVVKVVPNQKAASLIVDKIDASDLQVIRVKPSLVRGPMNGAKDIGATDSEKVLGIELGLRRPADMQQDMMAYQSYTEDPRNPLYGRTLTAAEFAKDLGLSGADLNTLTEWLQRQGFNVISVDNGRLAISITGTVAQVESAFHTTIHNYTAADGTEHFAPASDVKIPAALAPAIARISGVDNFRVFTPAPFAAPATDFAAGTIGEKLTLSEGGKAVEPKSSGMLPKDAAFTASKYSMLFGDSTTLNLRLAGLDHPVTGTVSVADNGKVIGAFDISECHSYNAGYGRSCTADFTPATAGSHVISVIYSGDDYTRGVRMNVVANATGSLTSDTAASTLNSGLYIGGGPDTWFTAVTGLGTVQPTGSVSMNDGFGNQGTATLPATGVNTSSGTGTDFAGEPTSYHCSYTASEVTVYCQIVESDAGFTGSDEESYIGEFATTASYSGDSNYAVSAGVTNVLMLEYTPTVTPTITTSSTLTASTYGQTTSEAAIAYTLTGVTGDGNPGGSTSRGAASNDYQFVQLQGPTAGTGTSQFATSQLGTLVSASALSAACEGVTTITCAESTGTYSIPAVVTPGSYSLALTYSGDSNCTRCIYASASTTMSFTEGKAATSFTSVTAAPGAVIQGTSAAESLSANLSWAGVGATPTGAVTFTVVNGTAIAGSPFTASCGSVASSASGNAQSNSEACTASVPAGTVAALAAGTYTVTPVYAGDTNYGAAPTSTTTFVVGTQGASLSAAPASVVYGAGSSSTLTYTISGSSATTAPTGTVTLTLSGGVTAIGSITVNPTNCPATTVSSTTSYACTFNWTPPAGATGDNGGSYSVEGSYGGDTNWNASAASTGFSISPTSTTVTLSPTATQFIALNGTVTFTVAGTWTGSGVTPTGTISLTCNAASAGACSNLPSVTLNATNCTISTGAKTFSCPLAAYTYSAANIPQYGAYYMVGNYSGDANYSNGASSPTTVIVSQNTASTTTITAAPASVVYYAGTSVTYTIVVTNAMYTNVPSGTVTLSGTVITGSPVVVNLSTCVASNGTSALGKETCTEHIVVPVATAVGSYTVTAAYSGDGIYGVSSGTKAVAVTGATPTLALTPSPVTSPAGSVTAINLVATATGVAGGTTPGGLVTFTKAAGALGTLSGTTCTLVSGTCFVTYTPSATQAVGTITNAFTASEAASGNYLISNTADDNLTTTVTTQTGSLSSVSAPFGSVTPVAITATSNANGAVVTFGTAGMVGGSFSSPTCTIAGGTCTVNYVPSGTLAQGTYAGDLTASFSAAVGYTTASATSTLTITAPTTCTPGALCFTSVSHNFGQVQVGTPATAYGIVVSNHSTTTAYPFTLNFTASKGFTTANNCGTMIAAGASCNLQFYFMPAANGAVSTTWSLASEGGFTYFPANGGTLTGSGTGGGGVSATTAGHNFLTITDGTTSPTYGVELSNSTMTAQTLSLGTLSGTEFTVVTNCTSTLAAGSSCELEFNFKPTTPGAVQAVYALSSPAGITAGGNPLPNGGITLKGTGH
jgi:hypothetical protein